MQKLCFPMAVALVLVGTTKLVSGQNCVGQTPTTFSDETDACCFQHVIYATPAGICDLTCAQATEGSWVEYQALRDTRCDPNPPGTSPPTVSEAGCEPTAPGYSFVCSITDVCHTLNTYKCEDTGCPNPHPLRQSCEWVQQSGTVDRYVAECAAGSTLCFQGS